MKNIELVQHPIIKHQLEKIGAQVSSRLAELNLENQVATDQTIQNLKTLRADLNKELAEFEAQRKAIKEGVNNPYLEFEAVYKTEIAEKYKAGIDALKDKIAEFEDNVKREKTVAIKQYFEELCAVEQIDFIKWENLGIDVNLSTSEKKYKEQVSEFISKVLDDLALVKTTEYQAEILAEYKRSLNVSQAIVSVKERKEEEALEAARIKHNMIKGRQNMCTIALGMKWEGMTSAFEYNPEIFITQQDIENLSQKEFNAKFASIEAQIAEVKKAEATQTEPAPPPTIQALDPLPTPTIQQEPEPVKVAKFEVRAPMAKLRALGEYMRNNGIEYKNI